MKTEQITLRLRQAADAVDNAGLADDLRPIGFERALDALDLLVASPDPAGERSDRNLSVGVASQNPRASELLEAVTERLKLPIDAIERIYEADDRGVRLAIKRTLLPEPDRKAAAMRHIALLIVVGRQAAGVEESTAFSTMREECAALKVLDGPNFASEIAKLDFRVSGGRNSRTARANRHHFDEAAELIQSMLTEPAS